MAEEEGFSAADPSESADDLAARFDAEVGAASDPYAVLAGMLHGPSKRDPLATGLHGRTLGGFRLTRVLGSSGMGITYAGVDADGEPVAVKVLSVLGDSARKRFANEWRLLRALRHPGIVRYRAHGVGPDGRAFLAMDQIDGQDLEQVLSELEDGRNPAPSRAPCSPARMEPPADRTATAGGSSPCSRRSPRRCTTRTGTGSCTATSSRRTSCCGPASSRSSSTSGSAASCSVTSR